MGDELGELCTQHGDFTPILLRKSLLCALPCRTFLSLLAPTAPREETRQLFPGTAAGQELPPGSAARQRLEVGEGSRSSGPREGEAASQPWGCVCGFVLLLSLVFSWSI